MKFTINNNKFYLNDVKLDKLISYSIEANVDRTKLTIELIVDDVEIDSIMSERRNEDEKTTTNHRQCVYCKKIIDHVNERKSIKIDSNLLGATIYSTLQEGFR